jgi:hypothetical protein
MRVLLFLLTILFAAHLACAVGTKKRKQKIHVRREFVAFTQAQAPVELHSAHDTFHSLRCKGTGMEKCGWRTSPRLSMKGYTLDSLDRLILKIADGAESCTMQFNDFGVHYRRLPNGYEYTVEDGYVLPQDMDSLWQADLHKAGGLRQHRVLVKF